MNAPTTQVAWLDARETVSVGDLARTCGLSPADLDELVEYGALSPLPSEAGVVFSAEWVAPLRTAGKLRQDFDLDLFTVSLVMGYLVRIDALERELRTLRAHLPGHAHATPREGPGPWREPHG